MELKDLSDFWRAMAGKEFPFEPVLNAYLDEISRRSIDFRQHRWELLAVQPGDSRKVALGERDTSELQWFIDQDETRGRVRAVCSREGI